MAVVHEQASMTFPLTTDNPAQVVLDLTRAEQHPDCLLCGTRTGFGFCVKFQAGTPGKVQANFACHSLLQGYPETLHGGVTAALLDAAMTNCLFSLGVAAVTAELTIRYLHPIDPRGAVELSAALESSHPPLHRIKAAVRQNGITVARAKATFFERSPNTQLARKAHQ